MQLAEALQLIQTFGPGAIFALWAWMERQERKEVQAKLDALGERGYTALEAAKVALDSFKTVLTPGRGNR